MEVEGFKLPKEEVVPICRSARTHQALDRLFLNLKVDEHSLGDLNEPTNYKASILDSESNNWVENMNAEMQSMKDNQVWHLVDLPPNCKTVGSKWLFKKKSDMDGNIDKDIYMVQPEGFVDPNHFRKVCKLQRSLHDLKQASRIWNKRFDEEIKRLSQSAYMDKILKRYKMDNSKRGYIPMQEKLDLNKTQGALTPKKVKRMQNDPYASAVGFETNRDDIKSQTGYISVLNGGAVDCKSSKQSTTAMSAT
nr:hypothetical protein [Tanacetum cinerariifolium]